MKQLRKVLACLLLSGLLAAMAAVPAAALSDVPEGFWAKEDIERCLTLKYFYPESGGGFGVGKEMSRAEFTAVLCRFFGWNPTSPARAVYDDVSERAWYAGAIEAAYHRGAITSQDGSFRPDDFITRSEAAAMLVRALGYGSIAGLIQETSLPFQDVRANNGYIVMAYGLGLMDGTSVTTFSPDAHITREQAAAIIMRLHDKLHGAAGRSGIAASAEGLPDLEGYEAVGIAAAKLTFNGAPQLAAALKDEEVKAIQAAAASAGTKCLLYVSGGTYHLRENGAGEMASVLLQAVEAGGYDGLFVDISGLSTETQRDELTATARILREKLGKDKLLYIAAEAPSWKGEIFGYDYAALGELADRLVLRVSQRADNAGDQATAPLEPLERIYYGLNRLRGVVDAGKLSLLLTSSGSEWNGADSTPVSGQKLTALMEEERGTQSHYSSRYACAYLTRETGPDIWYLNGQSIQERVRLARLFGGGHICLSDLNSALPEVLATAP